MATEKLKFYIELYSTHRKNLPTAQIKINEKKISNVLSIDSNKEKPTLIEFEYSCEDNKEYKLIIDRQNKSNKDTIINEKGDILHDQLLHIKSIEIDEIDIGGLVFEGVYTPEYPEPWATLQKEKGIELPKTFKNVTQMGHNGTWTFTFTSPFYMWLLENLY